MSAENRSGCGEGERERQGKTGWNRTPRSMAISKLNRTPSMPYNRKESKNKIQITIPKHDGYAVQRNYVLRMYIDPPKWNEWETVIINQIFQSSIFHRLFPASILQSQFMLYFPPHMPFHNVPCTCTCTCICTCICTCTCTCTCNLYLHLARNDAVWEVQSTEYFWGSTVLRNT